jgi:hypothetical protein
MRAAVGQMETPMLDRSGVAREKELDENYITKLVFRQIDARERKEKGGGLTEQQRSRSSAALET